MTKHPNEMVERVARAIGDASGFQRDNPAWPADQRAAWLASYERQARAAIAAMLEPTEEMRDALSATNMMWRDMSSKFVWQTYVKAALGETP